MLLQAYGETFLKWLEINCQKSIILLGNFKIIEEQLNKCRCTIRSAQPECGSVISSCEDGASQQH